MAIYHLHVQIIGRSAGRTACAAAAYRAGDKVTDRETGQVNDYTRKRGVVYSEIDLPENAPEKYIERENLWNAVQEVEKSKNAQLAREIEAALPRELDREAQIAVVRQFVNASLVSRGMAADWSIHDKGDGNPHVHIMATTRAINPDGTWATKERKAYALDANGDRIPIIDPATGKQKIGARGRKMWQRVTVSQNPWNDRQLVEQIRREWAAAVNRHLTTTRGIDSRSYKEQGVARVPTIHEGHAAREIEARGGTSELCAINRRIRTDESADAFMLMEYENDLRAIEKERKRIKAAEAHRAAVAKATAAKKNAPPSQATAATPPTKQAAPARAATSTGSSANSVRSATVPPAVHASEPPKPTALELFKRDPCAFVASIDGDAPAFKVETFFDLSDREYNDIRAITGDDALRRIAFGRDAGGRVYALAADRAHGDGIGVTGLESGKIITFKNLHRAVIAARRTSASASPTDRPAAIAQENALDIAERGAVAAHVAKGLGKVGGVLKGAGADAKKLAAAFDPTVSGKEKVKSGLMDIAQTIAQTVAKVVLNLFKNPVKGLLFAPVAVLGGAKDIAISATTATVGAVQSASEDERQAEPQRVRKWEPPDDGGEGEADGIGR